MQQFVELLRVETEDGFLLRQDALVVHVDGDLHHRLTRALAAARLQDPELALLDGELDVLHVPEVHLQGVAGLGELGVRLRHLCLKRGRVVRGACCLRDRARGADTRHHVLTLRVHEVLPENQALTRRGVPREEHARGAVIAEVTEDHRLHVNGGAPPVRVAAHLAVDHGARRLPREEHRADGAPELVVWVLRERLPGALQDQRLVRGDEVAQFVRVQVGVAGDAALGLLRVQQHLERVVLEIVELSHTEDDVRVHLDEAAVRVVDEPCVARTCDQTGSGLVVQTEVEDRVHHAGHRNARTGAHGDEQRVVGVAKAGANDLLDLPDALGNLRLEAVRERTTVPVVRVADLGGDGEARRDRDAEASHFREIRTLAAQERAVGGRRLPVSEEIDHLL